ncbi:MAG: hypothetical protein NC320_09135 [Clostridium sp.]|nr:hypothetical protein [Clostridium sp.]
MESVLDDAGKPIFVVTSTAGAPGSMAEVYLRIYSGSTVANYTVSISFDSRLTFVDFEGDILMGTLKGSVYTITDANERAIKDAIGGKSLKIRFRIPENAAAGTRYDLTLGSVAANDGSKAIDCMTMPGVITVVQG